MKPEPPLQPEPPSGYRRLYRIREGRTLAGVATGLAEHLGLSPRVVRIAFVALMAANGMGALLYIALWAVLPVRSDSNTGGSAAVRPKGLETLALAALGLGVIVAGVQATRSTVTATTIGMAALVALGVGIIWHQTDPQRRRRAGTAAADRGADAAAPTPNRALFLARVVGGGLFVIVGIIGTLGLFTPGRQNASALLLGLLFALMAMAGLVLVLAPLLWRIVGQVREERIARVREQERAEVAAIVHDQVLHTLALIQRNAGDPGSVMRLARGQERTLRGWLYKPPGSPAERLAAALEQTAAEVEDTYGITVETVIVGDTAHDERISALVAATREALVNAGRHAKVSTVSLYAEVEPTTVTVFVRDRGVGFDMSTVDDDRHGVRGSIIGRMQRHGGTATVKSAPGEGTEVRLSIDLAAAPVEGK